jgi:hypothetical protein
VTFAAGSPPETGPAAFGASTLVTIQLARRIPSRGPVRVVVANANGFAVTGRLAGRTARKVAVRTGRKRVVALRAKTLTIAAGARQTIRLALPRTLRSLLRRNGRIALRLTATVRDEAGNRRTVAKRATSRAKPTRR